MCSLVKGPILTIGNLKMRVVLILFAFFIAIALIVLAICVVREDDLHEAVRRGDLDTVRKLVKAGPDVNKRKGEFGTTALHIAAAGVTFERAPDLYAIKHSPEISAILIARGANVNARDNLGDTPLCKAATHNNCEVAQILIEAGADIDAPTAGGRRPLHIAADWGHSEIAKLLIEHGAEINAKDNHGNTPLHESASNELHPGTTDVTELLLKSGVDVHVKDSQGWTPLKVAVEYGCSRTAELLREHGAKDPP
jgi:ankyrin repeat protein